MDRIIHFSFENQAIQTNPGECTFAATCTQQNYKDMKNTLLFLLVSAMALFACKNDKTDGVKELSGGPNSDLIRNPATADLPTDTNQLARIAFEEHEFDFGEATEGDIVNHSFKFTNTGKVPLTIMNARSTCGCTIPEWPDEPIPPGGTGVISAKFNTSMKKDKQHKVITVTANTYPNESQVSIIGIVNPKK
jgi:hypothetical protein